MSNVPQELTERNKALLNDYLSKTYKSAELAVKYNISVARMYELIRKAQKKETLDK